MSPGKGEQRIPTTVHTKEIESGSWPSEMECKSKGSWLATRRQPRVMNRMPSLQAEGYVVQSQFKSSESVEGDQREEPELVGEPWCLLILSLRFPIPEVRIGHFNMYIVVS